MAGLAERLLTGDPGGFDDVLSGGLRQIGETLRMDWAMVSRERGDGDARSIWEWQRWSPSPGPEGAPRACRPFTPALFAIDAPCWMRLDDVRDPDVRAALLDRDVCVVALLPLPRPAYGGHGRAVLAVGAGSPDHEDASEVLRHLRLVAAVLGHAFAARDRTAAPGDASGRANGAAVVSLAGRERLPERHRDISLKIARESGRDGGSAELGTGPIVGHSPAIRQVLEQVRQVALTDSTVLLLGETGTGKELLATQIHELSARRGRGMVRVNCAAIPGTLIESELFGREKGAFTGALSRQIGRFEMADHSTIFLDEIGDLPPDIQIKLLRVLEERRIERLGSPRSLPVDVRIVAATHRDLEQRIAQDAFREDLFYRLNVFPIRVPALRERVDDIPVLAMHFVIEFARAFGKRIDSISPQSMAALQGYTWPGNIRELRNVVERAMIVASGPRLTIPLPESAPSLGATRVRLLDVEREHIRLVLERVRWRIRGQGGAADQLGLRPTTLETRMAKLGLLRPKTA